MWPLRSLKADGGLSISAMMTLDNPKEEQRWSCTNGKMPKEAGLLDIMEQLRTSTISGTWRTSSRQEWYSTCVMAGPQPAERRRQGATEGQSFTWTSGGC